MLQKINITGVHLETKTMTLSYLEISEQVHFSQNSSKLHFSLGLDLSLVCENGQAGSSPFKPSKYHFWWWFPLIFMPVIHLSSK